ncbi:MAG TPA: hypothetical protein VF765_28910 [Polyangiaceae bacterium]
MGPVRLPRALLLAALAAGVLACSSGGSKRLQGKWRGLRAEGVAVASQAAANAFATGMTLEVAGDSITVTTPHDKQSGRYKVVREDKSTLVLSTDKDGPKEPQTFTFVDDKTLKWLVMDGEQIVFSKQ